MPSFDRDFPILIYFRQLIGKLIGKQFCCPSLLIGKVMNRKGIVFFVGNDDRNDGQRNLFQAYRGIQNADRLHII